MAFGLGLRRAKVLRYFVRAISFQDFQHTCDPDPPTSQTDGRHAISIPRFALVHRALKMSDSGVRCDTIMANVTAV